MARTIPEEQSASGLQSTDDVLVWEASQSPHTRHAPISQVLQAMSPLPATFRSVTVQGVQLVPGPSSAAFATLSAIATDNATRLAAVQARVTELTRVITALEGGTPFLTVDSIGDQATGASFPVTGRLIGYGSPPTLQYADNLGAWAALPAGATVTAARYSFTHPAIAAVTASMTVTVRDSSAPSQSATSNAFAVINQSANVPGSPASLTLVSRSTSSLTVGWAQPQSGAPLDAGSYQVQYKASSSGTYLAGPTIPYCSNGVGSITDGSNIVWTIVGGVVRSTLGGVSTPDNRTSNVVTLMLVNGQVWRDDPSGWYWITTPGGAWTGPLSIAPTISGVTISSLASGSPYNVRVRVGNVAGFGAYCTPISPSTRGGVGVETLSLNPIGQQSVGVAFTVSGGVSGASSAPTLEYQDVVAGGAGGPTKSAAAFLDDFTSENIAFAGWNPVGMATPGNGSVSGPGGTWTVTAGEVVQLNGSNAGFTSGALGLWNVNGTIWHVNVSDGWYSWNGSGWNAGSAPVGNAWIDAYPFFANQYHLPAVDEREFMCSSQPGYYSSSAYQPFSIANSILSIKAQSVASSGITNIDGQAWNAGTMSSCKYQNGGPASGLDDFLYGYVEGNVQWPDGGPTNSPGYWPQLVLYPLDGVGPDEIDIFEGLSGSVTTVRQTIHSTSGVTFFTATAAMDTGFHRVGVDWQADFITFYVDGVQTGQIATPSDMKKRMYINCGLAVAGAASWSGTPLNTNPAATGVFQIDYIGRWTNFAAAYPSAGGGGSTGPWTAFPGGSSVSIGAFSFTHPAIGSVTPSMTVGVRDANATNITATSGSFAVSTVTVGVPGPPTSVVAGAGGTTITLRFSPPTTGGAIDAGGYHVEYKRTVDSAYTAMPLIPVITPGHGSFTDASGRNVSVTPGGVINFDGSDDTTTSNVVTVLLLGGLDWQKNASNNWYSKSGSGAWSGATTTDPLQGSGETISGLVTTTPYDVRVYASNNAGSGPPASAQATTGASSGGTFTISGGNIMRNNAVFHPKGLALLDSEMSSYSASTILGKFPGTNFIQLAIGADGSAAVGGYRTAQSNTSIYSWVDDAISHGLVVMLSDYVPGQPGPRTGTDLTNMANWYKTLALHYANEPNVWWTTSNEINAVSGSVGPMWTATYNAIRGQGNASLIFLETAWGSPSEFGNDSSLPGGMTGVGYNIHVYPGTARDSVGINFSSQATVDSSISGFLNPWKSWATSQDGTMPILMGEGGNSTQGNGNAPDDTLINGKWAVVQSIANLTGTGVLCGYGYWLWDWHGQIGPGDGSGDTLVFTTLSNTLSSYGTQVAAIISAG